MKNNIFHLLLLKVGDVNNLLVPALGCSVLFTTIVLIGLIAKWYLLAFFAVILSISNIMLVVLGRKAYLQQINKNLYDNIIQQLKKAGLQKFDLNEVFEGARIPYKRIKEASIEVYKTFISNFLRDYIIDERERKALHLLAEKLLLSREQAEELEKQCKGRIYGEQLSLKLNDKNLTTKDEYELAKIRNILGLTDEDIYKATKDNAIEAYKTLFRKFAESGISNAKELEELLRLSRSTGLSPEKAATVSQKEAKELYRRTVTIICQDGIITEEEENIIEKLENLLQLPKDMLEPYGRQIIRIKELSQIRRGKLPFIDHDGSFYLKSTELCHWFSYCKFQYQTRNGMKELYGKLIVTDRRIIFTAPERSIEFQIKKIINVGLLNNSVVLELSSTKGQGWYYVNDSEKLEIIIEALIRRTNYLLAERLDKAQTRHIPDDVKIKVWHRDGGKCVKCGAAEYLEYDHIIPFSRGGASTENNVQLLCRKCNLSKRDELL
jgi:hypothetical protein